jgi:dinuclear metal center YbgI/SA1388 family protein
MVNLRELVAFCDEFLESARFQDYCPNGLQVQGRESVRSIVSGVTASQVLIDAAIERRADLLLVHHGYFWRGEDPRVIGMKARRLGALLRNDISLLAYHLPLDAHPELGNNARLAADLELAVSGRFGPAEVAMHGETPAPESGESFAARLARQLGREPLHIPADRPIRRVGWCSGAAQDYLEHAAALGLDAYVSGEISERTFHTARELGIHYFAAGHHATERYGVQALGELLAGRFGLVHTFVDEANPV